MYNHVLMTWLINNKCSNKIFNINNKMFTINNKILIIYHRFITNSKKNKLILINHKFNNNNTNLNPNSFINLKISSNMIIKHIIIKNNLFKLFTKNQL